MTTFDIILYLNNHYYFTFMYKSRIYTLLRHNIFLWKRYVILDSYEFFHKNTSLKKLFNETYLHDGTLLAKAICNIETPKSGDPSWFSYEAIRHDVVVLNQEISFTYKDRYFWISHSKSRAYLSDNFGNSNVFDSKKELFESARIDGKRLNEIWDDIVID